MNKNILLLFVAVLIIQICSANNSYNKLVYLINRSKKIKLFQINEMPTGFESQDSAKKYSYGYLVIQEKKLRKTDSKSLKYFLIDSSNFEFQNAKSCPFVGKYLIEVTTEKGVMGFFISQNSCGKILVKADFFYEEMLFDLGAHSKLDKIIAQILNNSRY